MNYDFNINNRRVIQGPNDKLMMIAPVKHKFAREIWRVMLNNTWFASEVNLSTDVKNFGDLTDSERAMYEKALAFLSNLDGIQLNNLVTNINHHITSPEISMCLVRQAYEEALHVEAYSTMIEAMDLDPMNIYTMFARDAVLARKNEYILRGSEILGREFTPGNFLLAVVANIILEGIYFYSGFLSFYTLAKNGKMLGSAKMVRFIQRDEITHLHLFVNIYKAINEERPELFTRKFYESVDSLFKVAVDLETSWGQYITCGGVLGLTDTIIRDYIEYLADTRRKMIDLPPIYSKRNPVPWVDKISNINNTEASFFEDKVDAYSAGGLEW